MTDSETRTRPRFSVVVAVRATAAAVAGLVATPATQDVAVGDLELVVAPEGACSLSPRTSPPVSGQGLPWNALYRLPDHPRPRG
ncbi:MAG: hypothetical protein ACRDQX_00625 [Pseudonocardiaceae bacterium]